MELTALYTVFPQYGIDFRDIVAAEMSRRRLSSLVYWSRQKRALAPVLTADADTLAALGLSAVADARTVPALARALAGVLADVCRDDYAARPDDAALNSNYIRAACAAREARQGARE